MGPGRHADREYAAVAHGAQLRRQNFASAHRPARRAASTGSPRGRSLAACPKASEFPAPRPSGRTRARHRRRVSRGGASWSMRSDPAAHEIHAGSLETEPRHADRSEIAQSHEHAVAHGTRDVVIVRIHQGDRIPLLRRRSASAQLAPANPPPTITTLALGGSAASAACTPAQNPGRRTAPADSCRNAGGGAISGLTPTRVPHRRARHCADEPRPTAPSAVSRRGDRARSPPPTSSPCASSSRTPPASARR